MKKAALLLLLLAPLHSPASPAHINVSGQVISPGRFEIPAGEKITVSQAISMAGGAEIPPADMHHVKLIRKNPKGTDSTIFIIDIYAMLMKGSFKNDVVVQDGDTIYVPRPQDPFEAPPPASPAHVAIIEKGFGLIEIPRGKKLTISQAFAKAGGSVQFGSVGNVRLIRKNPDGKTSTVTIIDLKAILKKGSTAKDVELQDGDTLVIPPKILDSSVN